MKQHNPTRPQSAERVGALWRGFVGMFGGDVVRRRYGDTAPAEWEAMIGNLKDYELERGMRRLVYSGKTAPPSLPEFLRLCRTVGDADGVDDVTRQARPGVPDHWSGDGVDAAANRHLLAYLVRAMAQDPRRYGRPASELAMRLEQRERSSNADASQEFVDNVHVLVRAKALWAEEMRAMPAADRTALCQRELWTQFMAAAEHQISAMRASVAV
jgi:hypothetical protein